VNSAIPGLPQGPVSEGANPVVLTVVRYGGGSNPHQGHPFTDVVNGIGAGGALLHAAWDRSTQETPPGFPNPPRISPTAPINVKGPPLSRKGWGRLTRHFETPPQRPPPHRCSQLVRVDVVNPGGGAPPAGPSPRAWRSNGQIATGMRPKPLQDADFQPGVV
jgi:hypothetical protein